MKKVLLVMGSLLVGGSVLAANNPTTNDLRAVEAQLRKERLTQKESEHKAQVLTQEVKSVQGRLVTAAKQIQQQENRLSLLERQTVELKDKRKELTKRLNLSNQQLARVMKGMQTLALRPTELLIFQKKTPVEIFRSRSLMKYSIPIIGQMRDSTLEDLKALAETDDALKENMQSLKKTHTDLKGQTDQMNRLLIQKKLMQAQYTTYYNESKRKAEALAAKAQDLKDLLQKLEKERQIDKRTQKTPFKPSTSTAFAKAYGRLAWPVSGKVKQAYGDQTASGVHSKGVTLSTRMNAQITTPYDGTILFAGPFQNYGELIIIDHGDEYLTVLAGMGEMDVSVGQEVLAGEPIASMKNNTELYIEMRHKGQTLDPTPWFQKGGR